jgi:hypothetical protein
VEGPIRRGFDRPDLPLIVVSSVAPFEGGPLTILEQAVGDARGFEGANFLFLVHDAGRGDPGGNLRFLAVPWARRSYARRIFAEYVWFPTLSRRWTPDVWLSLNDTTPPVSARTQAVYCHNPLPYWRPTARDFRMDPRQVLVSFAYGLVYRTFARRNDYIVGQLPWYTRFIGEYMHAPRDRWLVVAPRSGRNPEISHTGGRSVLDNPRRARLECVYVSLPRVFKNFEEAIDLCDQPGVGLTLTISGDESRYARHIRTHAGSRGDVRFAGRLSHRDCLATMEEADVVLYPSRLETFGLPIQEAMDLGRTLVLPIRPWTVEIAAGYEGAYFYRSLEEGRAIVRALARGDRPPFLDRPVPEASDALRLEGVSELYRLLLS